MSENQDWSDGYVAGLKEGIEANLATRRTIRDAAEAIISSRSSTYKARNGRVMSIEDDSGEMCWIVPFDEMYALEIALGTHPETPPPPNPHSEKVS